MKRILLSGKEKIYTLVDDQDFLWANKRKWKLSSSGYVSRSGGIKDGKHKTFLLHRLICKTPSGMETDHINRNKLDNRRENLRVMTSRQNHFNTSIRKDNKTGFRGIHFDKNRKRWVLQVVIDSGARITIRTKAKKEAINIRKDIVRKLNI